MFRAPGQNRPNPSLVRVVVMRKRTFGKYRASQNAKVSISALEDKMLGQAERQQTARTRTPPQASCMHFFACGGVQPRGDAEMGAGMTKSVDFLESVCAAV